MFRQIRTERLIVRAVVPTDVDALQARRSEPAVAQFQSWDTPYPMDLAADLIAGSAALAGPTDGEWWMATVCRADDDEVVGDFAVHLSTGGRTAELGVTFASAHWGKGYAREAGAALVRCLFEEYGVVRVGAMVHPDNVASARLIEQLGMTYEGRTRNSFWEDGEPSDDVLYGMTPTAWRNWVERPAHAPGGVDLVEITPTTARPLEALETHWSQRHFVARVVESFGDALFPEVVNGEPVVPWLRAIEADGEPVGFVMVAEVTEHHPDPYLWRLLIDRRHQGRGIGRSTLDLLVEQCREWGASRLEVSWSEGRGSPRPFYERYGFVPTGRIIDGETEAILELES